MGMTSKPGPMVSKTLTNSSQMLPSIEKEAMDEVTRSFARCVIAKGFIDRFYELFLSSHPEIAPKFAKTEMSKQKSLLTDGISFALQFAAGNPSGERGMAPMRKSHSKKRMNIEPRFYKYWTDSLMQAISEKDYKYNDILDKQWRAALEIIVNYMIAGY